MSFDTLYRPILFSEVVGQAATIQTLKQLLKRGESCQSSYIFAGRSGAGKTTIARIFARAILCLNLTEDREPCNTCESCRAILDQSQSESFTELDAANNSGADTVRQIIESLSYTTFGGQTRKIYLFDEAHRLSTQAQDALLKPMEDVVAGSKDRRMVCFLCTTELEKIRMAIRSRSYTFKIQDPTTQEILARLVYICEAQGIKYEPAALELLIEQGHGHIRDMVRSLERVSQVCGEITLQSSREVLGLDVVPLYFQILGDAYQAKDNQAALRMAYDKARIAMNTVSVQKIAQGLLWAALETYRFKAYGLSTSYVAEIDALYERMNHSAVSVLRLCKKIEDLLKIFHTLEDEYALLYVLSMLCVEDQPQIIQVLSTQSSAPSLEAPKRVSGSHLEGGTVLSSGGNFQGQPQMVTEKNAPYMRDHKIPPPPLEDIGSARAFSKDVTATPIPHMTLKPTAS